MKKILYTILLLSLVTFISCNDDKEDEPEIDTFDYTFLEEQVDKNTFKIYDDDKTYIFENIRVGYDYGVNAGKGDRFLNIENDNMALNLFWTVDKKVETDTFYVSPVIVSGQKKKFLPDYYLKKGQISIKTFDIKKSEANNPLIEKDSVMMKGSINLQYIHGEKQIKMLKGVFYFNAPIDMLI